MKNKLIIIGGCGERRCFLNITEREAVERFMAMSDIDDEDMCVILESCLTLEFDVEFDVEDIWEVEEGSEFKQIDLSKYQNEFEQGTGIK